MAEIPRQSFIDLFTRIDELLVKTNEVLGNILYVLQRMTGEEVGVEEVTNYLTERSGGFNSGIVSASKPVKVEILKALGRPARDGYVVSDDGVITVEFNESEEITLNAGESHDLATERGPVFRAERIGITTVSATDLGFRIFLV